MKANILIAYASRYGATREISEKIGEVFRAAGLQADVLPVEDVRDISPYTAVVLGSALYIGKWRKTAVDFLQAHERSLSDRPVWLFSSGPTGEGDPVALLDGVRLPTDVMPIAERIRARGIAVFHGYINPQKMNMIEKLAIKAIKKPTGDFRDWNMVTAWAAGIAPAMAQAELASGRP